MPREKSLYEVIAKGVADAIVDIREKVVEEPWFGRVVTNREAVELDLGWPQARDVQAEPSEREPNRERDLADEGMDR